MGKPDPEIFLVGARKLGLPPEQVIVFEDAVSGVEAALKGGFFAVGVGKPEILREAHLVLPSLREARIEDLKEALDKYRSIQ